MWRTLLVFVALIALWRPPVANLAGRWTLDLLPDFGGNTDSVGCSLTQNDEKLTLDCGGGSLITGDVQGRTVTLRVPTGDRNKQTATMVGQLDDHETTVTGTWKLANDHGPSEGRFVLKKASGK